MKKRRSLKTLLVVITAIATISEGLTLTWGNEFSSGEEIISDVSDETVPTSEELFSSGISEEGLTEGEVPVATASYNSNWRFWNQGQSDYANMRAYGCWVTAQAKLLYETGVDRSASFNPDTYMIWQKANGYLDSDFNQTNGGFAPVAYANQKGKNLEYLGNWNSDAGQLWFNINAGYYTIVAVPGHYVYLDNEKSKATGQLYCDDSSSPVSFTSPQLLSRYKSWKSCYVYRSNGNGTNGGNDSTVKSSKLQFWGIENNSTIKGSQRIFVKSTNVPSSEAMTVTVDGNYMSTEGQDPNGFYSFVIDTTKYTQSLHNITVSTNSTKETIYFYFSQEMVHAIDSPAEGITLAGDDPLLLTVSGWANNSEGKVSCKFYIDGSLIKTIADSELVMRPDIGCIWGYQFNTNVSNLQNGKHTLTIETEVPSCYRTCKMNRTFYIKKSHTHSWNSGVVTKAPSCTVDGTRTYTCTTCGEEKTESISAVGHNYGEWKIVEEATVFTPSQQIRVCSICGESERQNLGTKLEPTMEISETNVLLRVKQATRVVKVSGLAKGDAVQSWKSSNNRIVKVSGYTNGTSLITAGTKTGNAVITVTLKSGMQKNITIIVQKNKVSTEQVIGVPQAIELKVKQKITLQNQVLPITSTDKVTYKSSNSKIVTVNSKGQIVAKKKGTVVITVRSGKISVKCNVTVG